jgi:hypothetical protein
MGGVTTERNAEELSDGGCSDGYCNPLSKYLPARAWFMVPCRRLNHTSIEFTQGGYRLTRLHDYHLGDSVNNLCVGEYYPWFGFTLDQTLNLAEFYVALTVLTGSSGRLFNDYKGSFCFVFLLEVIRDEETFPYILRVRDHRGSVSFVFHKILLSNEHAYDMYIVHKPLTDFPQEDMERFSAFFYDYLKGCFTAIKKTWTEPFELLVESQNIVYGYRNGCFFEEQRQENAVKVTEKAEVNYIRD